MIYCGKNSGLHFPEKLNGRTTGTNIYINLTDSEKSALVVLTQKLRDKKPNLNKRSCSCISHQYFKYTTSIPVNQRKEKELESLSKCSTVVTNV